LGRGPYDVVAVEGPTPTNCRWRLLIADETGRKDLDLAGDGRGEASFLVAQRTPQNLGRALDAALANLKSVPSAALP
jgi:hypothetical protein